MAPSTHSKKIRQSKAIRELIHAANTHFKRHGRTLPWRHGRRRNPSPYAVFVSECMLQQTQVERVIPKYEAFLKRFPSWDELARAPLSTVVRAWSGLGYNRRARYLRESARIVIKRFGGILPRDPKLINDLPGVGPYTAAAVAAFAFGVPAVFIETNIRTVFLHHYFVGKNKVKDVEMLPLVEQSLAGQNPRHFYAALMDYGAHLKLQGVRLNYRSAHYTKQTVFRGSLREARGAVLRYLLKERKISFARLAKELHLTPEKVATAVAGLVRDGLVRKKGVILSISNR